MFVDPKWARDDSYVERRWEMAAVPGAWEATQAARFRAPFRQASAGKGERDSINYGAVMVPTLVFAGRHDPLRNPGYTDAFVPKIAGAQLHIFENAAHMGNIECADEFNTRVLAFLNSLG
jgi:pimeloyl-ACP methyl ester carboxylesterase